MGSNIKVNKSVVINKKIVHQKVKRGKLKFILKLLIFILFLNLPTYIFFQANAMNYSYMDYPMWKVQKDFVKKKQTGIVPDLLVFGDSRGMAGIIPNSISNNGRALCVTGGTSIEAYYMLKEYLSKNSAPKNVILSVSPDHLERHPELFSRAVKYKLLSSIAALEVLNKCNELKDYPFQMVPIENNYYLEWFLYRINFVLYYKDELQAGKYNQMKKSNWELYNAIEANQGYWYRPPISSSDGLNDETRKSTFLPSTVLTYYFNELINLCKEKNIHFIFQTMPMNEASFKILNANYVKGYKDFISGIQAKNPYFEISNDLLEFPNDRFSDPSHLNNTGALEISKIIKGKYFNK